MLSMSPIASSSVAVSYYEKDDYYAANGDDPDAQGQWFGDAADKLGLSGAVDRDTFKDLLDGKLPDGTELGTVRESGGDKEHRPGWDLTFSAPKSVSLLAEIGGDKRIVAAHQAAVRSALGYLERSAAATRIRSGAGAERVYTGNLVAATFQHDTNRNHDPQLHTHAVVLNVTQSSDGRWRSLDSKPLFENKMAAGSVYRSALAIELQKLGHRIEQTHADGRFEIAGVSGEAIHEFSTRRQEIVAAMLERGLSGPEAAAQAALLTRSSKVPENRAELAQDWRERANAIGFNPGQIIQEADARGSVMEPRSPAQDRRALQSAIGRLSDQEAAFKQSALVTWTLANGMGKLTVDQAEALIETERAAGRLHEAELGQQRGWTTISATEQEKRVQAAVEGGKAALAPAYASKDATAALQGSTLNASQRAAVEMILTTPDRHVGVLGRPGTGKTFMLGQARALMTEKGFELVGMAANSEAARQLEGAAGIPSRTLHKHLYSVGRDAARLRSATPEQRAEIEAKYSKQVWVVDEASQVNNATMRRVLDLAGKLGARTVHVGDTAQLGAIEAGKPFARMVANGMEHREMDEIRRQTDARHVEAIRDVLKQDIGAAMQKLAPETREIPDRDDRLNAMLKDWEAAGQQRDQVLMLSTRNATRTELNDKARQILRAEGKLQGEKSAQQLLPVYASRADTAVVSTYKVGQLVHFPRALPSMGIERGAYVRVTEVDGAGHHVHLDVGGKTVVWSPQTIAGGSKTPPQIFQPRETSLAAGERITWSKNNAELGLNNGQRLTVIASNEKTMTVQTEDGRRVDIDRTRESNRHWEHGYATTIYKSQGQTAEKVLVDANSQDKNLLSQKAFLVAVSRQKDGLTVYTDSTEKLTAAVQSNTGDKLSAVESRVDDSTWRAPLQRAFSDLEKSRPAQMPPPRLEPSRRILELDR